MSTRTIWDEELGDYRPVTEKEVRAWVEGVSELERTLNEYIHERRDLDREFQCETVGGDSVRVEYSDRFVDIYWTSYRRCGSREEEHTTIPLEHLWASDWSAVIRSDMARREQERRTAEERAKAAKEAEAEQRSRDHEAHERAMLRRLQEKYGTQS